MSKDILHDDFNLKSTKSPKIGLNLVESQSLVNFCILFSG